MIPVGFHSKNEYGHVKEFAHNIDQMYISHIIKKRMRPFCYIGVYLHKYVIYDI